MRRELDARTLRWAARKAESEAQLTYDMRDSLPAEHADRWKRLDKVAGALSSFGRFLSDEARRVASVERKRARKEVK